VTCSHFVTALFVTELTAVIYFLCSYRRVEYKNRI